MNYDVFISYSSHDQKVVEALCAYLEQHKIRCFVAYRDIPRGVVWARAIVEALEESSMMVVVFSEKFNDSDQVDREIELASEDKKPILTFRITDCAFRGAKKYYLKNLNWIDAFPQPEQVFGRVLEDICKLLGRDLTTINVSQSPVQGAQSQVTPQPIFMPTPKPSIVKTYNVGDYYDDGTKQGVVFKVSDDGRHGKIVSLMESSEELRWAIESVYRNKIGTESSTNGADNMKKVQTISGWRDKYPAFRWCADLGEGWYLPAIEELKTIFCDESVHKAVNATLEARGATQLPDIGVLYWSSTDYNEFCAWVVSMYRGYTINDLKNYYYYVRAVSAF